LRKRARVSKVDSITLDGFVFIGKERRISSLDEHHSEGSGLISVFLKQKHALTAFLADKALHPEDIEDILQEVASVALEQDSRKDISSPQAYLFIIARNLMYRYHKSHSKRVAREISDLDLHLIADDEPSIEQQLDGRAALVAFAKRVGQLPPQCRKVFLLRKIKGWPHKKIASYLGISTSTVERHITNALTRLDALQNAANSNKQDATASHIRLTKTADTNKNR